LVDDENYAWLSQWKWTAVKRGGTWYAVRTEGDHGHVYMHKQILQVPEGCEVDHCNGDGCDNQVINLRAATRSQNQANRGRQSNNTTGYKGVRKARRRTGSAWVAQINIGGRDSVHLGTFPTPEAAARAYDAAALAEYGEFAHLNFPP
jgi:hypothetical protein